MKIFAKIFLGFFTSLCFCIYSQAQGTNSLTVTSYYPSPYGVYKTIRLYPNHTPPTCDATHNEGALHYADGTTGLARGLYYCSGSSGWQLVGSGGGTSYWTLTGTNLYTTNSSVPPAEPNPKWNVGIGTTTPNAALQVIGAISRQGATLYGNTNAIATHVNLGVNSFTGKSGTDRWYCTVSGGLSNTASGDYSTVSGGGNNTASGIASVVSGGKDNTASGDYSVVSGGNSNKASGNYSAVSGGENNTAKGNYSTVSGGFYNQALGTYSTVPGGAYNAAVGDYSFAAGYRAIANDKGSFVWASFVWQLDGKQADCYSQGEDTFTVCAKTAYLGTDVWRKTSKIKPRPGDVAEFMDILKSDAVQETELVALREDNKLGKTTTSYDKNLIGVISSERTTMLNLGDTAPSYDNTQRLPVALVGPVYVKVNNQNGKINIGDPVTSSNTQGIGMKATRPGKIIGYAMENQDFQNSQTREILVFINVGYYLPENTTKELENTGVETLKQELKTIKQQLSKQHS